VVVVGRRAKRAGKLGQVSVSLRLVVILIVVVLVALLAGAALGLRTRRALESRSSRKRTRRGLDAEARAEKLLKQHGYRVLGRQVRGGYELDVNGAGWPVQLSADYLVMRDGQKLVVEVKTGDAARLGHADTRRQMLEYQLAFGVRAAILLDADRGVMHEVTFPLEITHAERSSSLAWLSGVFVAASLGLTLWWIGR
jgi:hypothetical protein